MIVVRARTEIVITTGDGTIVATLLDIVGAPYRRLGFFILGGSGVTGFNVDAVHSAGSRNHHPGAVSRLFRRRML